MKNLSIFVDESGDFGAYSAHSPYYIVTMVLHDQSHDISAEVKKLNNELALLGFENHVVHTEPLIRREEDYRFLPPNERRSIFTKLYYFTVKCDIRYKAFIFQKRKYESICKLERRMAWEISSFIRENLSYFQSFRQIILYYDNGQYQLNRILNTVFAAELVNYDIRKVLPSEYRLFQAADLICTLELLRLKVETGSLTHSELLIFHSEKELKKDFLKRIQKKSL